jgi:alkylhydroperoxidase/carboxymuconolactone decarboxylase family protein YurZ
VSADTLKAAGDWTEQWVQTLGFVPDSIAVMHEWNPAAEEAYRSLRTWLYEERPDGLSPAMKELITIVIDVIVGQDAGALNHLRAGIRHGLTATQVREALTQCFMLRGINTFGTVGHIVWEECKRLTEAPAEPAS